MRQRCRDLVNESLANNGPVWVSYKPGMLVEMARLAGSVGWECSDDGRTNRFAGAGWTVYVVA